MIAILKREMRSYFSSPIGYVCIAVLCALFGFYYYWAMLMGSTSYIPDVYSTMFMWCMMIIPIITMRSMTDDRKNKTDQALLTAPVGVTGIVMGKFLAAFCVFGIAMVLSLVPAFVMSFFGSPVWAVILGTFFGTLLYGGAMISIGVFISSLTESQIIAAIGTFAISIFLMVIGNMGSVVGNNFLGTLINWISFENRYTPFTNGSFNISSIVFFLSVMAIFVFITARKLESRRWS